MFNGFHDPVEKQMVVEFFCVVAIILKRHPELRLDKVIRIQLNTLVMGESIFSS